MRIAVNGTSLKHLAVRCWVTGKRFSSVLPFLVTYRFQLQQIVSCKNNWATLNVAYCHHGAFIDAKSTMM